MKRVFCTYFDHHYLPRGLALFRSLERWCPDFELWVLCFSQECHRVLTQLGWPRLRPIALEEFERDDAALLTAKAARSRVEYYFTCSPSLPLFVLARQSEADLVTYLDADLMFFSSPEACFAELGAGSIAIIGHRFPERLRHLEETGIYNVGWATFCRDTNGLACLRWWRERCLEWCHDRVEPGRYGDQKYLDRWPELFPGVVVLENPGANLAPWNLANYTLRVVNGQVDVDGHALVFFHFHGFQEISARIYRPHLRHFGVKPATTLCEHIFTPYRRNLAEVAALLEPITGPMGLPSGIRKAHPVAQATSLVGRAWQAVKWYHRLVKGLLRREYVLGPDVARATAAVRNRA
jgi:hypothetical protein